ncbi:deoxyribose-phosphate aldolase [Pampinifervens florentissimum]|uniref:deoxyribose-phosphate aldolase n=1 Tax=Pampinifervens florentissimum TaxID=1632019 RepID=UPI0013B4804B|nr:deoxyribose-phosphate aldolase [Hydrogenobacter sp. T-8]QID33362.1 deoxyribose-phosphate aldolase [Hydrogenobacter sp. T-8]
MDIAKFIDHSILRPNHTLKDLEEQVRQCIELGVYAVCVNPFWVRRAVETSGGRLVVCSVVSFPFGLDTKEQKVMQAVRALEDGASELDIVLNISALKSGMYGYVEEELKAIARNTEGVVRKVIIETAYLSEEEKRLAVELIADTGMAFVKTSTGYAPSGATEEDIKLLIDLSRGRLKIKASGGIRTRAQVLRFLELGAERIGTSSTFEILGED